MIQFLGFLKNPLVKFVANKTMGAITHKLEKDKIIKAKELEAANNLDVKKVEVQLEQVRQQQNSWKDEWLVLFFSIIFILFNKLIKPFYIIFYKFEFFNVKYVTPKYPIFIEKYIYVCTQFGPTLTIWVFENKIIRKTVSKLRSTQE